MMAKRYGPATLLPATLLYVVLGAAVIALVAAVPPVSAADLYVGTEPGDFPTVQAALDAATNGDRVILRQGTYTEDITIDKPGIQLLPDFGTVPVLDGDITVGAAAGGLVVSGVQLAEGKHVVVEDGIHWPTPPPAHPQRQVVLFTTTSDGSTITLGDVSADADLPDIMGAFLTLAGEGSTISHSGTIAVDNTGAGPARGVSITMGDDGEAALGHVQARGGQLAIGMHFFTGDGGQLTVSGDVAAHARDALSVASGAGVRGQTGVAASFRDVEAEGGRNVSGLDFNVGRGGSLVHSGEVRVEARDAGSAAYGVQLGAGDGSTLTVGDVAVEGGGLARGATTTYEPGTITVTEGLGDHVDVQVGHVRSVARDADSEAYGVELEGGADVAVAVADVAAEGGRLAQGVSLTAGDGGSLTHSGNIAATARDGGSQAYGIHVTARAGFSATVGHVEASADGLARAAWFVGGDGGQVMVEGGLTATSASGPAHGLLVAAGDGFGAAVRDVRVEGGGNAVQGVSLNVGAGGRFTHEGLIDVAGTSPASNVRGVNIIAGDNFSAAVGDVAAYGPVNAVGIAWTSTDGASLTHTGTIRATTAAAGGNAAGASISTGHGSAIHAGDVVVVAQGGGSTATGFYVQAGDNMDASFGALSAQGTFAATGLEAGAGDGFTGRAGSISATGQQFATGASLAVSAGADVELGSVNATGTGGGSTASGVIFSGGEGSRLVLGDVAARAGQTAWAVDVRGGHNLALDMGPVTAEAGTAAYGAAVEAPSSTVTVHSGVSAVAGAGTGVALALAVDGSSTTVVNHGRIYASGDNATGIAFGRAAAMGQVTFRNLGVVERSGASGSAVWMDVAASATVENEGTIDGGGGVAFAGAGSTGAISLTNTGTILGDVWTGQGADTLEVSGTGKVAGNVDLGEGNDRFVLGGQAAVEGHVHLGGGDDAATLHHGAILTGLLDGGDGANALELLGDGAGPLPPGWAWTGLSARRFQEVSAHGGAWQWGAGTELGRVDVYDGLFRVDGDVAMAALHLHGGALTGTGNVTGDVVNDGGTLSPGNAYGILTITGDYVQGPGGVLAIELDASGTPVAGVNYGQLAIAGGTAVFQDGTTVRVRPVFGPTLPDRAEYTIVDGDVIFDPEAVILDIELPRRLFFDGWLEPGSMKLVLGVTNFDGAAETGNQEAVARALDEARGKPDTDLDDLYEWLKSLEPGQEDEARAAFDSLSGEVYSHLPTLGARRLDGFVGALGRGLYPPEVGRQGRVWAVPYGDFGEVKAGHGTAASRFRTSGVVAGADLYAGPGVRIGATVGAVSDRLEMDSRASEVWGNGHQLGLYGHFNVGRARLTALLGYGRATHHSQRTVQSGPGKRVAGARFRTADSVAWVEARFPSANGGGLRIEPAISLGRYHTRYDSFREQGAGTTGLVVDGREATWFRGRVGVELKGSAMALGSGTVVPRAMVAWVHDFSPVERVHRAHLQGAPAAPFTIHGTGAHRGGFEASLGLQGEGRHGFGWSLGYTGEFRRDGSSHTVMGRLSFGF